MLIFAKTNQNTLSQLLKAVDIFVQKEIKKFRDSIKTGDKVITAGGIYGKVKDVKDTTILLEIADNVRITIDKNSVYANAVDSNSAAEATKA